MLESLNKNAFIKADKHHVKYEMIYLSGRYNVSNFIETGTHLGETVIFMAEKFPFDKIHSVEISGYYIDFINNHFQRVANDAGIDVSNIKIWKGNSVNVLPSILSEVKGRSLFWLDAHCSGGDTAKSDDYDCTILKEIEVIKSSSINNHIIVIDDMNACKDGRTDYPTISEISDLILSINEDYLITVKYNVLFAEVPSSIPELDDNLNSPVLV